MNTSVCFQTENGISIEFYLTEDNYLCIKCNVANEEYTENPFKIHKPAKLVEIKDSEEFCMGKFWIKKESNGYSLFTADRKIIYRSELEIVYDKNGAFVAIESEWDRVGLIQTLEEKRTYFNQEMFFGMGEASDTISLENHEFTLYHTADLGNQELLYIPFYFTKKGYAVYYNANGNDVIKFEKVSDEIFNVYYKTKELYFDCYMYSESSPQKLISKFYTFSESNSLLPKWAFGYIQSKFGYESEEEIYDLLEKFDQYNLPVSAIVIDYHWYKYMGDLDWNRERFPDYEKMCDDLKKRNIKLLTISQPYYTKDCKNYAEFDDAGIFAKRIKEVTKPVTMIWGDWWCKDSLYGSIINPIAENADKIIGEKYVQMKKKGLDGFWLDLGEPENVPPQTYFNQYPEEEFHLHFANEWIKLIYNAVQKACPNDRLFILSRCGYTGTAKYNVSVWSGDSSSTFTNLEKQIAIGINAGLTGFSYWGSDAGGFLSQLKLPEEELYIRWLQFACFTPVFRTHGKKTPREPWCYGGKTTELIVELVKLRDNLLPYIYTAAYQTYKNGIPMMRPMFMEHPDDEKAWKINKQYYFGDSLLVAPIYKRINEENKKYVYLPKGDWFDFYTLQPIKSGEIYVNSCIDRIPVYIKSGSVMIFKNEILVVDPETESTSLWYNDDGETNAYLQGDYEEIKITLCQSVLYFDGVKKEKNVRIKIVDKSGNVKIIDNVALNIDNTKVEL